MRIANQALSNKAINELKEMWESKAHLLWIFRMCFQDVDFSGAHLELPEKRNLALTSFCPV